MLVLPDDDSDAGAEREEERARSEWSMPGREHGATDAAARCCDRECTCEQTCRVRVVLWEEYGAQRNTWWCWG
eukprot:3647737-Rhodomonas_salina.1